MNSENRVNHQPVDNLKERTILLIVDDNPRICRILTRRLAGSFDGLHAVCTKEEAEQKLKREPVSHLICDNDLGENTQKGSALIPEWKKQYASIKRAVLFTGDILIDDAARSFAIDAVVCKTMNFDQLMKSLDLCS